MRITKISVKGLFGMFDHEIPLNQESRITIIHGPNGAGKTTLMQMLHGLFQFDGEPFGPTPVVDLQVFYEDGAELLVRKSADGDSLSVQFRTCEDAEYERFVVYLPEPDDLEGTPEDWHNLIRSNSRPEWFGQIRAETVTEFIHTLRIQGHMFDGYGLPTVGVWEMGDSDTEPAVTFLSDTFLEKVFVFSKYANYLEVWYLLNDSAKSELDQMGGLGIAEEDDELQLYFSERRERLQSLREKMADQSQNDPYMREILLFLDIMNERYLFKSLTIRNATIKFVADNGNEIPFSALSSGEQHLLLLYYHLIFEIEPDTLVMIDEPELSMNVVWQRNFLKDLQRIIELRRFDVLIATHSPMIIHDNWDWVVHLGEKVDD